MSWMKVNRSVTAAGGQQGGGPGNGSTVNIRDLGLDCGEQVKVRGLVIGKTSVRLVRVSSDDSLNSSGFKAVFNFTVRDSVTDLVNVTSWGRPEHSRRMHGLFQIGDVVSVSGAAVERKTASSQQYHVQTGGDFNLVVKERSGLVEPYYGGDSSYLAALQNTLLHSMSDHVTLLDMIRFMEAGAKAGGGGAQHFTFLAAVVAVGQPRELLARQQKDEHGRPKVLHKLDVTLRDETCRTFPVTVWDPDWVTFVQTHWLPGVTVVSLVDCAVRYDEYRRGFVGAVDGRSVAVLDPEVPEARRLQGLGDVEGPLEVPADEVPLACIQNVLTARAVKAGSAETVYGIVYGVLSSFPLDCDDPLSGLVALRCRNCKKRIMPRQLFCSTIDCPMLGQDVTWTNRTAIELECRSVVSICDHTGTLARCSLAGPVMEALLGCSAYDLVEMTQADRAQRKWDLFLNRYKFFIKCSVPSFDNSSPFLKVLGVQRPTVYEILASVKE